MSPLNKWFKSWKKARKTKTLINQKNTMLENQIGKRYAEALSGNIGDDSRLGDALQSLKEFDETMKTEKQLLRFFEHPSISTEKKKM